MRGDSKLITKNRSDKDVNQIDEEKSMAELTFHPQTNHNTKFKITKKYETQPLVARDMSPVSPVRPLAMNSKHLDKERLMRYNSGLQSINETPTMIVNQL